MAIDYEYKLNIAKKHHDLIIITHQIGRNVIWRQHLWQFVKMFKPEMSERVFRDAIHDLKKALIIEEHRFINRRIYKLRKFGLSYIYGTTRNNTSSVTYSSNKAVRNAYICHAVLAILEQRKKKHQTMSLEEFCEFLRTWSTLLDKDKATYHYLQVFSTIPNVFMNRNLLEKEYNRLKNIKMNNYKKLNTNSSENESSLNKEYGMSLNSLQSRDIFLYGLFKKPIVNEYNGKQEILYLPRVFIMDIGKKYAIGRGKKLRQVLREIVEYFKSILGYPPWLHFDVIVYVDSKETKEHYECLYKDLIDDYLHPFDLRFESTNLKTTLFGDANFITH